MNARRIVALHEEAARAYATLARVHGELAEELAPSEGEPVPADEPSAPRPKRATPKVRLVRPAGDNDELARRKATTFLRRNGFMKADR